MMTTDPHQSEQHPAQAALSASRPDTTSAPLAEAKPLVPAPERFAKGDRVIHPGKPEWGNGIVQMAEPASQDGRSGQRLSVRFDRAGAKTVSTLFVELRRADAEPAVSATGPGEGTWIDDLEQGKATETMLRIPEPARDPFRTPIERLGETLGLYRFRASPAALLDWAAMQSGLSDPLSRFSRHELEEMFSRFIARLDDHLARTIREIRESCAPDAQAELAGVIAKAPAEGQRALQRVNRRR